MAQIQKLIQENQKLKYQLEKLKSSNGLLPYIDDSVIKGGYRVVKNIAERNAIDCCHRKLGMKVLVIGEDLSFKEYVLKSSNCKENVWEEVNLTVEEALYEALRLEAFNQRTNVAALIRKIIVDSMTQTDRLMTAVKATNAQLAQIKK